MEYFLFHRVCYFIPNMYLRTSRKMSKGLIFVTSSFNAVISFFASLYINSNFSVAYFISEHKPFVSLSIILLYKICTAVDPKKIPINKPKRKYRALISKSIKIIAKHTVVNNSRRIIKLTNMLIARNITLFICCKTVIQ